MDKVAGRIVKVMERYELTSSLFGDEIGVARSMVSHVMSGRNKPGLEFIQKVLKRFPEVSPDWLLLGKGAMIKGMEQEESIGLFSSYPEKPQSGKELTDSDNKSILTRAQADTNVNSEPEITMKTDKSIKVTGNSKIIRIVLFYDDQTFQEFFPQNQ